MSDRIAASAETGIAERLARLRAEIADLAGAAGRPGAAVELVAVAKSHPAAAAEAAIAAGQRLFGENRVQEAGAKWPALRAAHPAVRLHLIGGLQTNKVRDAVALFDVIETVDRPRLAAALAREMARRGRRPDCLVQVNTGAESQKSGVAPEAADAFVEECRRTHGLPIVGLMCVPPVDEEPALHFALLAEIARRRGLVRLSMGMTADYATAIRFGATHVRLGTAVFGPRPPAAG